MRFVSLDLVAFGSFTKTKLSFGSEPGKLSLVYGPNEAGKSTLLRALSAVLFQIPTRTEDAHLHEMGKLRIGAQLLSDKGATLSIVRRKGNKQTLLDHKEQPLDEKVLSELTGGVSEALFRQLFALDHERLREGAEELLEGQGGVGESLFAAGLGTRSLSRALTQLKAEADELYKARGQTPKLNASLKGLRERERERKDAMLSPQAVDAQRKALQEAEAEQRRALEARRENLLTRERLERHLRAVPLLGQIERVERDLLRVGDATPLSDAQALRFETLSSELSSARAEAQRVRSQLAAVEAELRALPEVSEVAIDDLEMAELSERFGSYRKAQRDLPLRRSERDLLDQDIRVARERLGWLDSSLTVVDAQTRARLVSLSDDASALAHEASRALTTEKTARAHVTELTARREALPVSMGHAALSLACDDARQKVQSDRIATLELGIKQKTAQIERQRRELQVQWSLAELKERVFPGRAEIDALSSTHEALRAKGQELTRERARNERELKAVVEALARSEALSALLSEDALRDARGERDRLWHAISDELQKGGARITEERIRALDRAVQRADEHADRLRRESTSAAEVALKLHQRRTIEEALFALEARFAVLDKEQQELERKAEEMSAALGLERIGVARLSASYGRVMDLVADAAELSAMQLELTTWTSHRAAVEAQLREALKPLISPVPEDFSALLACALDALSRLENSALELERISRELEGATRALREAEVNVQAVQQRQAEVEAELLALCQKVGLLGRISGPELRVLLEGLKDIELRLAQKRELEARIEAIVHDSQAFTTEARALCARALPDLIHAPLDEAFKVLRQRHQEARDVRRDRERLIATRESLSSEREHIEATLAARSEALTGLLREAGVVDESAFRSAFMRAREREGLQNERTRLEQALLEHADGASIESLAAELDGFDVDDARARVIELSERHEALEEDVRQREQQIGRLRAGLETFEQTAGAFEVSEDVEAELAAARTMVRRYVEVRLATQLLAREIERYRALNQAPVLARATSLFRRLTLERYRGLDVEYGESDRPLLCAVRHDGVRVLVSGLSDGTRDQLYLALRLSSIERFLDTSVALPLVLDDAFVHFDDERTRAALEVLSDVAQRTQVLYFTHHPRVVELARATLEPDRLLVHKLSMPSGTRIVVRDDGPLFSRG